MADPTIPALAIGIDLGGTKLLAGLVDQSGAVHERHRVEVAALDADGVLDALAGAIDTLGARAGAARVVGAGVGVPATIDQERGVAVVAANLPLRDVPIRTVLAERTGRRIAIDNDANVAALAEQRLGAGRGVTEHLLMITLGTGLGGGIVVGGELLHGSHGAAGELGHLTIDANGPPCVAPNCPGRGCVETFVSGSALARIVQEQVRDLPSSPLARAIADGAPARGETVVALARAGDEACTRVLERMGEHLGVALASFVNVLDPGLIAVGGGLSPALDLVLPSARRVLAERALPPGSTDVRVVPAQLGEEAGMVGAGLLAFDVARREEAVDVGSAT